MLIVVVVGILTTIVLPFYQNSVTKSKYQQRVVTTKQIYDAEKMFF